METVRKACYGWAMDRSDIETTVASHYSRGGVTERILDVLGLQDATPGSVPIEALFPVDQLHHGGVKLTERMAEVAGVTSGMRVLDAGSGIGGSARLLASRHDCSVEAMDLSEEFVETARELDGLTGLTDKIRQQTGSVLDLPFDDASFDVVWSQNVTMNVDDKATMFAEAFRVLKPGGIYVLTHIGAGNGEAIDYPVPWAMTEDTSFVTAPDLFEQTLADTGFSPVTDHVKDAPPPPPPPLEAEGAPSDAPAMGDDMPLRRANTARAVGDGRLVLMLVTAVRP